jgi:hypothetical protein
VLALLTYALFETVEILKFCFFMFDKDKNGFIHKDEFILFLEMIHARDHQPSSNIIATVERLDVDNDGKFTWAGVFIGYLAFYLSSSVLLFKIVSEMSSHISRIHIHTHNTSTQNS